MHIVCGVWVMAILMHSLSIVIPLDESFSVLAQFTNTTAVFTGSPAVVTVINDDDDDDGMYNLYVYTWYTMCYTYHHH